MVRSALFLMLFLPAALLAADVKPLLDFREGKYSLRAGDEGFCPSRPELAYEESAGTTALRLGARFVFTDIENDAPAGTDAGGCALAYETVRASRSISQKTTATCKDPARAFVRHQRLERKGDELVYTLGTEGKKESHVCRYRAVKEKGAAK